MFEDFSSQEEQLSEQKESHFDPVEENIIKEIGVPVDLPPEGRAESISEAILELPPELQVPAIEMVVENAAELKADGAIANILRNIIKTELGRGLEQDLKDKIVDLAYEIDDIDLQKTLLVELEKAGILVRKYEGPAQTSRVETTKIVPQIDLGGDDIENVVDEDVEKDVVEEVIEEIEVKEDIELSTKVFDFSGEFPPEGWQLQGDAYMTGNGEVDENGAGWLRLTDNLKEQHGYALYAEPIETAKGLSFDFDFTTWSMRTSGGSGMVFFLIDGKTDFSVFEPGAAHSSLGYAPKWNGEGMTNAVIGIALDEAGDFSKEKNIRPGGPGQVKNSVSVRAGENAEVPFEYIAGTESLTDQNGQNGIHVSKQESRPDQTGEDYRHVSIQLKPEENHYKLDVSIQMGAKSKFEKVLSDIALPMEMPETVKFGFSATTTGATSNHEINNVVVIEGVNQELAVKVENSEKPETNDKVIEQTPEKVEQVKEVAEQPVQKVAEQALEKVEPVKEVAEQPFEKPVEQVTEKIQSKTVASTTANEGVESDQTEEM